MCYNIKHYHNHTFQGYMYMFSIPIPYQFLKQLQTEFDTDAYI